jgi:triosephosphate isomerase (TIM)
MLKNKKIRLPFFEIGPKAYMFGDDMVELAKVIDQSSKKYDIQVILTPQYCDLYRIVQATENILVFAQHMDSLPIGRGLGSVLPESVKAAGASGVMLNHAEKPIPIAELRACIKRAEGLELYTIVCADSIAEAKAIANLGPDIIVCEPSELIGTGKTSDEDYVKASISAVKSINPEIAVLQGAGISNGDDVYRVIRAGAEATGTTSGIMKAKDKPAMVEEMISAVRRAWDEIHE